MSTFRDLQRKCKELGLKGCGGRGVTSAVLRAKILASDDKMRNERLFAAREPEYYETIRELVPKMPDMRPFESKIGIATLAEWNNEKRWEYLLIDFTNLDESTGRGDTFDAGYIEYLDLLDTEKVDMNRQIELSRTMTRLNLSTFFIRYPALSWILVRTNPHVRGDSLFAEYDDWVKETVTLDSDEERVTLAAKTRKPGIFKHLLDIYSNEELEYMKIGNYSNAASFLYHVATGNTGGNRNMPLIEYLLERKLVPERIDIIKLGRLDLIKKMEPLLRSPLTANRYEVKAALRSGDPAVLRYIISHNNPKYDPYYYFECETMNHLIVKNNFEMVRAIGDTGGPLHCGIEYAAAIPHAFPIFMYLIRQGINPIDKSFVRSIHNPEALKYLIDNYSNAISKDNWEKAIRSWITPEVLTYPDLPTPPTESLYLLLQNHKYSKEFMDEIYQKFQPNRSRTETAVNIYNATQNTF